MTNEVITLQCGNYSNYLAAHFWNIQQSKFSTDNDSSDINHDVLFREGTSQNKATYTPRMILYDLKDNINIFRTIEAKPAQVPTDFTWSSEQTQIFTEQTNQTSEFIIDLEKTELKKFEAEANNKGSSHINLMNVDSYYKMENEVQYWPDYLKVKYHDRSFNTVNQYQTSEPDSDPFDLYHYGQSVSKESDFMDTFEDKLRHYGEECDHIQGFQLIVDAFNGFGGIASNCMNLITEEYRKKSILAALPFPYFKNQKKADKMTRLINTSFTLKSMIEDNKDVMVVPLSLFDSFLMDKVKPVKLPHVNYQPDLDYHTSAILASFLDSFTLPWRQKNQRTDMNTFFNLFDTFRYKVAGLQAVFPLNIEKDKYLVDFLKESNVCEASKWFTPLCSSFGKTSELVTSDRVQGTISVCCNGLEDSRVKNTRDRYAVSGDNSKPAHAVLENYFTDMYPKSLSTCFSTPAGLSTKLPFPNVIKETTSINSVDLLTILQINKSIKPMLDSIELDLKSCDINKFPKFFESGMELDDFTELKNFANELAESF